MITPDYLVRMAAYNRWQNRSIYGAADTLTSEARRQDRGAFFRSIEGTLNHLIWGDEMWLHRFAETPKPSGTIQESASRIEKWEDLKKERAALDEAITAWAEGVDSEWLAGDLVWFSRAAGREFRQSRAVLVVHFFNHQTHHRGQVHAMLTAAGAKPEDTDLILMPGLFQ